MASLVIVHESAGLLKNLIECVRDRVAETKLIFDEHGMRMSTVDVSRVCLVNCFLSADIFSEYSIACDGDDVTLGVSLVEFSKILKCAASGDQVRLSYDGERESDVLQVSFAGVTNASFDMKLYDLSEEDVLDVPTDLVYQYQEVLPCSDFTRIIKSLKQFSENVDIVRDESDRSHVLFIGNGDGVRNATFRFAVGSPFRGSYRKRYALLYIESFTKASSMADSVTLKLLGEDQPPLIVVEYCVAEDSYLQFFLASKLEEE